MIRLLSAPDGKAPGPAGKGMSVKKARGRWWAKGQPPSCKGSCQEKGQAARLQCNMHPAEPEEKEFQLV